MFGTFILGILAGWGAPYAEPKIREFLDGLLLSETPITAMEMRSFALALCLLGAAILSMVFGEPHAVPLALGAAAGVFGPRLIDRWKTSRAPDYDS